MLEFISRIVRCSLVSAESSTIADTEPSSARTMRPYPAGFSISAERMVAAAPRFPVARAAAPPAFLCGSAAHRPAIGSQTSRARESRAAPPASRVRAALRLLQHGLHAKRRHRGGHVFRLMAHHRHNFARLSGWQARTTCSTSERPPARCSTFASADFSRVPLPAARTITAKSEFGISPLSAVWAGLTITAAGIRREVHKRKSRSQFARSRISK